VEGAGEQRLVNGVDIRVLGMDAGDLNRRGSLDPLADLDEFRGLRIVELEAEALGIDEAVDIPPYATSTLMLPSPGTSTCPSSTNTKPGTLSKVTLTHLPSRHSAVTGTSPAGASSVSLVTGSCMGIMPVSRSTVTVQMVLVPDIGT
jgi:hypothetical protein